MHVSSKLGVTTRRDHAQDSVVWAENADINITFFIFQYSWFIKQVRDKQITVKMVLPHENVVRIFRPRSKAGMCPL